MRGYLGATFRGGSGIGLPFSFIEKRGVAFCDQNLMYNSGQSGWVRIGGVYTSTRLDGGGFFGGFTDGLGDLTNTDSLSLLSELLVNPFILAEKEEGGGLLTNRVL